MQKYHPTYNDIAGQKTTRIEAISDGVFAIALTLLVLELKVPVLELGHSEGALIAVLLKMMPAFLTYFLSFLTLGIFWVGQNAQFNYIERSDRNLYWISLFFLLSVSILPFTTAFLAHYIEFKFAVGLYWLNILFMGVTLFANWVYAYRQGFVELKELDKKSINHVIRRRLLIGQALYTAAALTCFYSTYLSIILIVLIQLNFALGIFPRTPQKKTELFF